MMYYYLSADYQYSSALIEAFLYAMVGFDILENVYCLKYTRLYYKKKNIQVSPATASMPE